MKICRRGFFGLLLGGLVPKLFPQRKLKKLKINFGNGMIFEWPPDNPVILDRSKWVELDKSVMRAARTIWSQWVVQTPE